MTRATGSSRSCFLLTVYSLSVFGYKEVINWISTGHLAMSVCKVVSSAVEKGCLL